MAVYGYIRVSTADQNPERQVRKMLSLGIEPERMFVDYASGRDLDRPRYRELQAALSAGDSLVVDSLDRLGRSYDDVTAEWRRLVGSGIDVRCLDLEFFDSAKLRAMGPVGVCVEDMLLSLLAYVAQTEREKMRQRQAEGIAVAKEQGKYKGRMRLSYPPETLAAASDALAVGGKAAAARVLGCSVGTVSNMLKDGRLSHAAA